MADAATPRGNEPAAGGDARCGDVTLAELAPVSHAIFRVARLHKMLAGQLLRRLGLYPNQELIMMRLWSDGPQRQVDLVRMLESEAPTITRTIRRLEKAGLVSTSPSPTDRRSIIVEATSESMHLLSEVEQAWATLEACTVGDWPDNKRENTLEILSALETNLLQSEGDTDPL